MSLESYIAQYSFDAIIAIEESDRQFLALYKAWQKLHHIQGMSEDLFVFLVLECALISFQVAGSGPDWREEFATKIVTDCLLLIDLGVNNVDRWYDFLTHSRYNKRLYNIKRKRLEKIVLGSPHIIGPLSWEDYYVNMTLLCENLAVCMQQSVYSKTITLAIKMFGYAKRITTGAFVRYPMEVRIPVDSRLKKIYTLSGGIEKSEQKIQDYFQ